MPAHRPQLLKFDFSATLLIGTLWFTSSVWAIGGDATPGQNVSGSWLSGATLTLQGRIEAQRRIERIYHDHRIWPKENPQPKPSFVEMVPAVVIENKARDIILKSVILRNSWNLNITPAMLQQELERMALDSKHPVMLQELFAALDNDPSLIAETLARDLLSDALIRKYYAEDDGMHAATRHRAESLQSEAAHGDWRELAALGGLAYFRLVAMEAEKTMDRGGKVKHPISGGLIPIEETAIGFILRRYARESTPPEIETIYIPKKSFDLWWPEAASSAGLMLELAHDVGNHRYRLPEITAAVCDQWQSISTFNAPSGRALHSAVWTGSEMIIWGDSSSGSVTGGRYDPATNNWRATSTGANVPSSRWKHTAVWTGTRMIIWGGDNGLFRTNTGGQYDPVSDSWTSTSMVNVPSARSVHTAVWTGGEMIIWGGGREGASGYTLNTGGRYNPATDTWVSTSIVMNVPVSRLRHSAVWSGSEMIVWGGCNAFTFGTCTTILGDGGRYNTTLDNWIATSTGVNLPVARYYHSAIWTGRNMIVWGGADYHNPSDGRWRTLSSGGKYNPDCDCWLPTSVGNNVPSKRMYHTTTWTGSEMIVWGGFEGTSSLIYNSGGRYYSDPDGWLSTSTGANVPEPRSGHSAIWTGNEMIIWGGDGSVSNNLNTGAIYTSGSAPSPGNSLRGAKSSSINLTWSWVNGAGSYNVKRCDPTATGCIPATVVSTPTINQYSEPNDAISHFYAVEAVNQCGATP